MKNCPFCAEEIQDAARVCKHCGRDLATGAQPVQQVQMVAPKTKTSASTMGCATLIVLLFVGWCASTFNPNPKPTASNAPQPTAPVAGPGIRPDGNQAQAFIDRFGKPDQDESSESEKPRPPIVTRMLTYHAEGVRAIFRAGIQFGSKERVGSRWALMGYTDPALNSTITQDVAFARLAKRQTATSAAPATSDGGAVRLPAAASASSTQISVSNFGPDDWTDVRLELNGGLISSGYVHRVKTIKHAHEYTVGLMQFVDGDGKRFNPFNLKPQKLTITAKVKGRDGIRLVTWD